MSDRKMRDGKFRGFISGIEPWTTPKGKITKITLTLKDVGFKYN